MKKVLFFIIFAAFVISNSAFGQTHDIQVGDILTIEEPSGNEFQYVLFPQKNIIIKRGGIPDLDLVKNTKVEVIRVTYATGNKTLVTLKKKDGGRFFKSLFSVKAELEKALEAGELSS
ncbi:MAG: hypothetical protein ACR2MM_05820 [Flavobacteriaceae bacterium]